MVSRWIAALGTVLSHASAACGSRFAQSRARLLIALFRAGPPGRVRAEAAAASGSSSAQPVNAPLTAWFRAVVSVRDWAMARAALGSRWAYSLYTCENA